MDPQLPPLSTPYLEGYASSIPLVLPPVEHRLAPTRPIPVPRPSSVAVWGAQFSLLGMQQTLELADAIVQRRIPEYFVTANLNYLMLTEQFPRLQTINENAAAIIADGNPIVRRSRFTASPLPERVAGADLILELAKLAAQRGYRLFLLGAGPGVAEAAATKLVQLFPELAIAGCYSPPYRPLTSEEHALMLKNIRDVGTDILLVAFGQPKGEIWIHENLAELNVPLSIQLGASFDFLAGTARRAPRIWQKLGCEWLYRACHDPKRLMPRYAANIRFLLRSLWRDCFSGSSKSTMATSSSTRV